MANHREDLPDILLYCQSTIKTQPTLAKTCALQTVIEFYERCPLLVGDNIADVHLTEDYILSLDDVSDDDAYALMRTLNGASQILVDSRVLLAQDQDDGHGRTTIDNVANWCF